MHFFAFIFNLLNSVFNTCFGAGRLKEEQLDLSTLNSLIGTDADDVSAKLIRNLSEDSFTVKMFRKGYLTFETDDNGLITGFEFSPPQNYEMTLTGSAGGDDLVTGYGDDVINSGDGDDTINAGNGDDIVLGGNGNDSLYGGLGGDVLDGGAGDDVINAGGGEDFLTGGDGNDLIDGQDGNDTLLIDANAGGFSFNFIDADTIEIIDNLGGLGTDTVRNVESFSFADGVYTRAELESMSSGPITGTSGDDTLSGTSGDDVIYGLDGNDTINGGDGNDTLYGDAGTDTLYGDAGDDTLFGGANSDSQLYGGTGADTFAFLGTDVGAGVDTIRDFSTAEGDNLDLSDILTAYDPLTDTISDFVRITDAVTNSIVAVDVDGGGNSFQTIAVIENVTGLTDEQMLVSNGALIV